MMERFGKICCKNSAIQTDYFLFDECNPNPFVFLSLCFRWMFGP